MSLKLRLYLDAVITSLLWETNWLHVLHIAVFRPYIVVADSNTTASCWKEGKNCLVNFKSNFSEKPPKPALEKAGPSFKKTSFQLLREAFKYASNLTKNIMFLFKHPNTCTYQKYYQPLIWFMQHHFFSLFLTAQQFLPNGALLGKLEFG